MGIYDREYYRHDRSGLFGTLASPGVICKWLILINVVLFVVQLFSAGRGISPVTEALLLDTQKVFSGQVWRLITYAFLHDPLNLVHILLNMLVLWWFGHELESRYGPREFLIFYLVGVLAGAVAFVGHHGVLSLQENGSFFAAQARCLGASAGVTAVSVLFACHFPNRMVLLFFILPVPVWALVVFLVAVDAFNLVGHVNNGIAVAAHLGGALFGFVYYKGHWRLSTLFQGWFAPARGGTRPNLRIYYGEEEKTAQPVAPAGVAAQDMDEHFEAKVDAVLEKVARSGQESLTETERQILFRASEIYKKRRSGL